MTSTRCQIQEPVALLNDGNAGWVGSINPYVIVMVGLPGRGKSYMSQRINRWLNWKGLKSRIFNLGEYRRKLFGLQSVDHNWFDPENRDNSVKRDAILSLAIDDLKTWIEGENGQIGIIDGTNSSPTRRALILTKLEEYDRPFSLDRILWVESICENEEAIRENILHSKIGGWDYSGRPMDSAIKDFNDRISQYRKTYVPLNCTSDRNLKFIQIHNETGLKGHFPDRVILNRVNDQFSQKISYFLMNLHAKNIVIYLTRHGESTAQIKKVIGTDAELTDRGVLYSHQLKRTMDGELREHPVVDVLCSTLRRSYRTAMPFTDDPKYVVKQWKQLNEINGGHFEGLTYDEVKDQWPKTYNLRQGNKYHCGWPGGESYQQMIIRLENIFLEIERCRNPMLIIAHQAICRGIYAYLTYMLPERCVDVEIASHTIYKFSHDGNQTRVTEMHLAV